MMLELLLDVMDSNHRIGAHACTNHTVPYGTALWGGAVPGTSCQATIAPSLRDISQQALARRTWSLAAALRRRCCAQSMQEAISAIVLESTT